MAWGGGRSADILSFRQVKGRLTLRPLNSRLHRACIFSDGVLKALNGTTEAVALLSSPPWSPDFLCEFDQARRIGWAARASGCAAGHLGALLSGATASVVPL